MKRIFLVILVMHFLNNLNAQDSKIIIGINASPTISSLRGNEIIKEYLGPKVSFSTGVSVDYYFSPKYSLRTGLIFDRKGMVQTFYVMDDPEYFDAIHVNYDYLVMPLLFSYSKSQDNSFYITGGPFIGYLLKHESKNKYRTIDYTESSKKFELGVSFGFGWEIPLSQRLLLDLGLIDYLGLLNTSSVSVVNDGTIKTNSLELKIGLKYKI
jgi:hypothetical protein